MKLLPEQVARELSARSIDGWLLYDFRGQNPTATHALGLDKTPLSRRWFYFVPASGEPVLLVHAIERGSFPSLPGRVQMYASRESLEQALISVLAGSRRVAMEYVPMGAIPTLSRVDAGTVERVRALGIEVVSSGDLVQHFLCRLNAEQVASHVRAVRLLDQAKDAAFAWVATRLRQGEGPLETDVQQFLMDFFSRHGLRTSHPPIVAAGSHSGDPHFAPSLEHAFRIQKNELLLIDLWAKENEDQAVWGDITWVAYAGQAVPPRVSELFFAVASARDVGLETVRKAHAGGKRLEGWQVDRAVRDHLTSRQLGERFLHRTGHNIDAAHVHGDGANLDDFETHDTRALVPGLAFSIEPGAYFPDLGIRSEIDVVWEEGGPRVYSPIQQQVVALAVSQH